jgi:ABC-type multidrug transport system fused ATPase/permease subunit
MLSVAVVAFVFAIVLFTTGHWPYGLILLGAAALLLAAFLESARRRPQSVTRRVSVDARERARSSWDTLRVRQVATAEARRIRSALMHVESERRQAIQELGAAAHAGDADAEALVRARLAELDERETRLRAELDEVLGEANERIRKAQLPVQETMLVPPEPDAGED